MKIKSQPNEFGFSLVEVLVALVVLSVGMMGIAALHGQSLSAARTAQYRSVAIVLASDMADRIRLNRLAEVAYTGAAVPNACNPTCTPAAMAANDLFVWNQEVQARLPGGTTAVGFIPGTTPPTFTITVRWTEVGQLAPLSYVLTFQQPAF